MKSGTISLKVVFLVADFSMIRKNSENIKSIPDFENFKCDKDNNVFVRLIGENSSILNDISNMDNHLRNRMAYVRIGKIDIMIAPEEVGYYQRSYEEWLRSFRKKAVIRCSQNNDTLSLSLGTALSETLDAFKKTRPVIPPSIERNFVVKLLLWYDRFLGDIVNSDYAESGIKVVGENVTKVQEYLFFYMVVVLGGSVLLIQNKNDLVPEAKKLELSCGYVSGHMGNTDSPEYTRIFNSSRRVSPDHTSYGNGSAQGTDQPMIRMTIPPRPEKKLPQPSYGNNSPQSTDRPPVRVTIPPHPNRRTTPPQNQTVFGSNYGMGSGTSVQGQQSVYGTNQNPKNSNITQPFQNQGAGMTRQTPNLSDLNIPNTSGEYDNPYADGQPFNRNRVFQGNGCRDGQTRILGTPSNQPRREKTFEELAQLASSVVQIFVMHRNQYKTNGRNLEIESMGSGIMIGENGYIVTNFHVVEGGQVFGVRIENDEQIYFTEQLIKYHRDFDLAVLRIDRKLKPLPLYNDPKGLVRGQKVVAIGSPHGLFNTVSDGIISGFRNVEGVDMIQFTAPVSPGSSGGAVLNMYGEVIGISRMIRNNAQNINLAVGYDLISNFCRSFI